MNYKATILILVTIIMASSFWATAQSEEEIIHQSKKPYIVVFDNESEVGANPSKRTVPGLYRARIKGKGYELAFPGDLLSYRGKHGIVEFLPGTNYNHKALFIIDGELVIASINSILRNKKSFIKVNDVLVDYVSNQAIKIGKIDALNNVQLHAVSDHKGIRHVLVSVKQDNMFGDGFTFFFSDMGEHKHATGVNEPTVIDYRFRSSDDLKKIITRKNQGVLLFSESLVQSQLNNNVNNPLFKKWIVDIKSELSSVKKKRAIDFTYASSPLIDLSNDALPYIKDDVSQDLFVESKLRISNTVNPFTYKENIKLVYNNEVKYLQGKIDKIGKGSLYKVFGYNHKVNGVSAFFVTSSGDVYLAKPNGYHLVDNIKDDARKIKKFHHVSIQTKSGDEITRHFIYSYDLGAGKGRTGIVSTGSSKQGSFLKHHEKNILPYFLDEDSLAYRLLPNTIEDIEKYDFNSLSDIENMDILTPNKKKPVAYINYLDLKTPVLNLHATAKKRQLSYSYLQELKKIGMRKELDYIEYKSIKNIPTPTGLYLNSGKKLLAGQLLGIKKTDMETVPVLDKGSAVFPFDRKGKTGLAINNNVYALDSNFSNGDDGFQLVFDFAKSEFVAEGYKQTVQKLNTKLHSVNIKEPFKRLLFVKQFVSTSDNNASKKLLSVVTSFKADSNAKNPKPYIQIDNFEIEAEQTAKGIEFDFKNIKSYTEPISIKRSSQLSSYISYESNNNKFCLNRTPELSSNDRDFLMTPLNEPGAKIYPGRGKGYKLAPQIVKDSLSFVWERSFTEVVGSWRKKISYPREENMGFVFGTDSPLEKSLLTDAVLKENKALFDQLDRFAKDGEGSKHLVLVFNDLAEKQKMKELIGAKFVNASFDEAFRDSYGTDIYYVDSANSVEEVTTNYLAMAKTSKEVYVFADMGELNTIGDNGKIDRDLKTSDSGDVWKYKAGRKSIMPHALYYLLTEGQQVELDQMQARTAPQHRTLVFSTIDEYLSASEDMTEALEAGLSRNVEVNFDYLETPWRLEASKKGISHEYQPRAKKAADTPIRSVDKQIYKDVDQLVHDMIEDFKKVQSGEQATKSLHKFYVVEKELKNTVFELLYGWYYSNSKDPAFLDSEWNHRNEKLKLFSLPKHNGSQEEIGYALKNIYSSFAAMGKEVEAGRIPFLIGDIADVASAGRVNYDIVDGETRVIESMSKLHTLSDYQLARGSVDDVNMNVDVDSRMTPHFLWWLANEGKKTSTRKFEEGMKSEIPMILIGTEDEVKALNNQISFESRFGLDSHFEQKSLDAPSKTVLKEVLNEYFDSRSFNKLGYNFSMPHVQFENAKEVFIDYFLKKTESLSRNHGNNLVLQFSRSLDELGRKLAEDVTLRRSKIVTDRVLEDVFTKVFDMPLNPKYLEATDPLKMVLTDDSSKFIDALGQQGRRYPGYEGPWELKNMFAKGLTAQVTSSKNGLNIPSSIITFGTTSTGKTFLWKKAFEVLGLNEYNFGEPHDKKDIRAMIVDLNKIVDDIEGSNTSSSNTEETAEEIAEKRGLRLQPIDGEQIPLSQFKLHVHNLLSKANGHRAYILFDDAHKANSIRIKKEVIGFLKTLFEAENGIYRFKSPIDGSLREIPVRNLTIGMTLNPDQESLRKQIKSPNEWNDIAVMADTLSDDGYKLEESFFHRWNKVINLSEFSAEAKAPSLISALRADVLKGDFTRNSGLVIPLPSTIKSIVDGFPNANAREFLPNASSELSSKGQRNNARVMNPATGELYTPLKILVPKSLISSDLDIATEGNSEFSASGSSKEQIVQFVDKKIAVVPVTPESVEARVLFMRFIADNFRSFIYTTLVDQISKNSRLMGDVQMKNAYVHPLFLALTDHLNDVAHLPIDKIMINPIEFGVKSNAQRENLRKSVVKFSDTSSSVNYSQVTANFVSEELFESELFQERKRLDVLKENTILLKKRFVKDVLSQYLRVDSVDRLPNLNTWLSELDINKAKVSKTFQSGFIDDLLEQLRVFQMKMVSGDVIENQSGSYSLTKQYDILRLFFYSLDKSIISMPWERIAMFLIAMNNEVSDDIHSVQELGLQHFIWDSNVSPFKTETFDRIRQVVEGSKAYHTYINRLGDRRLDFGKEFSTNCDRFFKK